jgi:hypothetical protein
MVLLLANRGDMEGMRAHTGSVRSLGLLVGSLEMVAADLVAVTNQLALKEELGVGSLGEIEIVKESIESVQTSFERPYPRLVHPNPNVEVLPGGICPGCSGRILKIPPHPEIFLRVFPAGYRPREQRGYPGR